MLPNLAAFNALHPEIEVKIVFEDQVVNFATSDIDAGLRYGDGKWTGLRAQFLHGDMVSPVCAPSYVEGRKLPLSSDEIGELLLGVGGHGDQDWADWFEAVGAEMPDRPRVVDYPNRARMFDLALSGNGVVLGDLQLIASDLEKGHLVRLHDIAMPRDRAMYLVSLEGKPDPKLEKFGDWLMSIVHSA